MTSIVFLTILTLHACVSLPASDDLLDEYVRHIDAVNQPSSPIERSSETNERHKRQNHKSSVTGRITEDWSESHYGLRARANSRNKRDAYSELSQWTHWEVLDAVGDVVLRWQPRHQEILFRVEAKTLGYVGIGFSPDGGMEGADMVLGWVDDRSLRPYLLVSTSWNFTSAPSFKVCNRNWGLFRTL